ncbi:MAG TPA: DUF2752 domain-containing protein [Thermoanaerobaculia bacterium]|jgi:hypothetical protein|nr:DUF2752 domain-containing protein [Thermoanaerobaculia bacterium]
MLSRRPVLSWSLAGLAGLAGLALLYAWNPSGDAASAICFSRRVFDLPCPGCGMTRAFAHLAKGEWAAAATDHPLAFVLALELILGWAAWGATLAVRRAPRLPERLDALLLAHAAVLVAFWLGRAATGTLPW